MVGTAGEVAAGDILASAASRPAMRKGVEEGTLERRQAQRNLEDARAKLPNRIVLRLPEKI